MLRKLLILPLCATIACSSFGRQSAVQVDPDDTARNETWHATLTSPASLSGVVQMEGTATMAPTADSSATLVTINLSNAPPGGLHPWETRVGQCGSDGGRFGPGDAYDDPLEVRSNGTASASATVQVRPPTGGAYFIAVRASRSNPMIVACGNFAAPSR